MTDYGVCLVANIRRSTENELRVLALLTRPHVVRPEVIHVIGRKVESITRKEILPLLRGSNLPTGTDHLLSQAIARLLGLTYLGDYALELGLPFDVANAADFALETAEHAGLHRPLAYELIGRLKVLYQAERDRFDFARSGQFMRRYQLKCADVVLAQMTALAYSGNAPTDMELNALTTVGALLDVVDDMNDIEEDRANRNYNPFTSEVEGPFLREQHSLLMAAFSAVNNRTPCSSRGGQQIRQGVQAYCRSAVKRYLQGAQTLAGEYEILACV